RHERAITATASFVDQSRDDFFADTALAGDEDLRVGARCMFDLLFHGSNASTYTHHRDGLLHDDLIKVEPRSDRQTGTPSAKSARRVRDENFGGDGRRKSTHKADFWGTIAWILVAMRRVFHRPTRFRRCRALSYVI